MKKSVYATIKGSEKEPSFVTHKDVITMLKKDLHKSFEDWKYVPQLPYPISLIHMPYPKNYETLNFIIFDEGKVAPIEHMSYFINALGPHVKDH